MRKNRVIEQNRCYHLVSRLAHRAFLLDDEEKDRAVALMRRVEAGVQVSMSYCINSAISISSDPFTPHGTDFPWVSYQESLRWVKSIREELDLPRILGENARELLKL